MSRRDLKTPGFLRHHFPSLCLSGHKFVAEHVQLSYYINHLIETDAPQAKILECSLKLVKAAKDVHEIGTLGEVAIPRTKPRIPKKKVAPAKPPKISKKEERDVVLRTCPDGRVLRSRTITPGRVAEDDGGERRSRRIAEAAAAGKTKQKLSVVEEGNTLLFLCLSNIFKFYFTFQYCESFIT